MFEEFIKHVARTLAAFVVHPKHIKCFEVDGIRNKKPPRKKRARLIGPSHSWYWVGGSRLWRCMSCLKSVATLNAGVALKPCSLRASPFVNLLADPCGHELMCADVLQGPRFVVLCNTCGAWATVKPRGLMQKCNVHQLVHRARDRAHLLAGFLPDNRSIEVGPFSHVAC